MQVNLTVNIRRDFWELFQWPSYTGWPLYTGPLYTGLTVFHSALTFCGFSEFCERFSEWVTSVRNVKKLGDTDLVSEIKCVENYPDFEKSAYVIKHGLQFL